MGVLKTSAPLVNEVDLPAYDVTVNPKDKDISQLIQYLENAKQPLILAGAGINHSQSNELLTQFVTKHQIPVATTLLGLGAIPYDNPLFLGMGGMHGSYASNMALTECDLLINLGSRFDDRLASNPNEFAPHATVVHVDIDESEINKVISTDLGIVADCKSTRALSQDLQIKLPMNTGLTIVLKISTNILLNIKTDDTFCKPQKLLNISEKLQTVSYSYY